MMTGMWQPNWNKRLDARAVIVFQRVQRFYTTFVILAALVSGLALASLTFPEFHPSPSRLIQAAEGLLCSCGLTAVVSALVAGMLHFQYEGHENATRKDLAVAWIPLILLDVAVVEFLFGITCWYCGKHNTWRLSMMAIQLGALLGLCLILSYFMWHRMSKEGGLGKEETEAARRRMVDSDAKHETHAGQVDQRQRSDRESPHLWHTVSFREVHEEGANTKNRAGSKHRRNVENDLARTPSSPTTRDSIIGLIV